MGTEKCRWPWSKTALVMAISYAGSGATKVGGAPPVKKEFAKWGYSRELRLVIGASELLCAGLLLSRRTARTGAIGLTGLMLGAAWTHAKHREYIRIGIPLAAIYPLMNLAIHAVSE
jgi:uncharacterized membrane protein YphA (DoxX/SURF4 family)